MAITKNLVVTLKDDIAELKDKMFIFRNDVGVEMIIELKDFEYSIDAIGNKNNFSKVSAIFRTPSSKLYSYNDIKVSNGKIRFVFTQDLINVMQEIGEYELQFQLFDKSNNRLTIPSYNFYVKEPLSLPNEAIVGEGIVGLSYVADDEIYLFSIEDGYIKTEWEVGDLITKEKLNKIENAIFDVVNAINNIDTNNNNNNPNLENQHTHNNMEILNDITADKINQWNNKSDFDGNYNNLTNKPTIPTETSQLNNDSGFITSIPSEYVTETELNSKGYLTKHQDISGKVDKVSGYSLVSDAEISRLSTLKNYDDSNIRSQLNDIENEINELKEGNIDIDLTNYVTKSELSEKADKSELHSHSNKNVLDSITSDKIVEWDNKSAFSGNYNDLINKPTIPTKVSELTNDEGYLTEHQDISGKVDKINGHSLVSDAEISRLATLENYDDTEVRELVDEINTSLDNIMKDFNEHITNHPSGDIDNIINSLEPSTNDIPKVYFTGDISGMNKDVEKILTFSYKSNTKKINGYVKMKWQGNSSLNYPKKNFTIKMFKDNGCESKDKHKFKNWEYETNKYVLKANYIDHSHARNIVSARLWNDIVKSRKDYSLLPTEYQSMPNGGGIDGFPIKLYINGEYQGLYTWNIGKEGWTYGMKSEKNTYAVLCGENYVSGCFRATAKIDETDWSLEYPNTLQNSIKTSWNNAISFVMNNNGKTFKNGLSTYFDVNSLIDYYIFAYFSCGLDSMGKNQIYTTYNGTKWYAHMYDMDSTWGLYWDGKSFVSSSYRCQEDYESMTSNRAGNLLYIKLVENFGQEIYERYSELRKTVLSIDNVIDRFERFTDVISNDLYKEDISVYNGIPSSNTNNIQQIRKYIVERANYVDDKMAELIIIPVPITGLTLNKSNSTVSIGSKETLTVSYIPTDTTQKGIIWSSSDTSKATVKDGVITGISEGNCVITATSAHNSSLKAICNVNIQAVREPVYELPSETVFSIANNDYIDTGIKLFDTDKSFTLFIDFTDNMNNSEVTGRNATVLHCMKEVNPWNGIVLDGQQNTDFRIASQSANLKLLDSSGNGISYYSHINQKYILVKTAGSNVLQVYNYNYKNIQNLTSNGVKSIIDNNLFVGCMDDNGTRSRYWSGTVHKLKVWFGVLETNEINKEFGENIF